MESERAENRPTIHPLTLWSINPRLQTRFDLDDGGGLDTTGAEDTTAATVTDDQIADDTQAATATDDTTSAVDDAVVDPEEAERIAWQKDFDAAPPRVQQTMIRYAERMKALEQEVERRNQQLEQPAQQTTDPQARDRELERFLVDNQKIYMDAQMKAINAQAAGNEAEYEKQLSIMGRANLNIGAITKEQARYEVMSELNARQRPSLIEEEFRAHKPFESVIDAAPGFARIEHLLTQGVRLTPNQARDLVAWTAGMAAQGKTKGKTQSATVTDLEKVRAQARAKSETPDGGVTTTSKGDIDKDMDAWVDRVLGLKKQRR